jgi:2-oxoglutarate dehydrogenase E1 component
MDVTSSYNLTFSEELYAQYLRDPHSVASDWRGYFEQVARGGGAELGGVEGRLARVLAAYRARGHRYARLDPLGLTIATERGPSLGDLGLSPSDLDMVVSTEPLPGTHQMTLRQLMEALQETYCRSIGVEYTHVEDGAQRHWLRDRMEPTRNRLALSREDQLHILNRLTDGEVLEQFLHTKFVGAKRFSLEGAETLIPMMDLLLENAAGHGVREVVIGMAHRGRLNVLVNVMRQDAESLFAAFDDAHPEHKGAGDVKYHLGFSTDHVVRGGQALHVNLCFNPSHLEWVNGVVEGRVRAKMDRAADATGDTCVPLLIHGDAAFAGQGTVLETMQLEALDGYTTGGTIHIVINNQVGFTTRPDDARSTPYCTDIGRMFHIPIFHVNGEDPEAVAQVTKLAVDWRQQWHRDVIIDMLCYRKFGHNEGDEPSYTQPQMYQVIAGKRSVREEYANHLVRLGVTTAAAADAIRDQKRKILDERLAESRKPDFNRRPISALAGLWSRYRGGMDSDTPDVDTSITPEAARALLLSMAQVPAGFAVHPKLKPFLAARREMASGTRPLDWGGGEALAYASLLVQGSPVRLSGQDSGRGTFSHRHAVLHDVEKLGTHIPLQHLAAGQARFGVFDSPLSEAGVLGFEYGYSLDYPDALVIWEAQFGDFVNAAQVIVDQFLASAEAKWNRLTGLTLFLPHGYEGQGPEHSSARIGRFLALCAQDNMQVCNVTLPGQLFHLLRRQVMRPTRKPLVLFTPKSLLRHKAVVSDLAQFTTPGTFQRILPDPVPPHGKVRRVLLCSGKVFFDLAQARAERALQDVAILRMEQLYPLPLAELMAHLGRFEAGTPLVWVQEEPRFNGAWLFQRARMMDVVAQRHPVRVVSRPESASPATGSLGAHKLEQARLVDEALGNGGEPG